MRTPEYISPTGIMLFDQSEEDFYERYLADVKTPRDPQYPVMAVGSAFDAFIKSYLYKELKIGDDPTFELRTLFEAQVEEQNRDEAWKIGEAVFEAYKKCGAAADLLIMLGDCTNPRFEFTLQGAVSGEFNSVNQENNPVLLGKPDLYFTHRDGGRVILDWKVNGYMSKRRPSPKKGYLSVLECEEGAFKKKQHKDVLEGTLHGIKINMAHPLELVDKNWARQLAIYGWLLGEDVGNDFIVAVDQIVCGTGVVYGVAQHRCIIGEKYQKELYTHVCEIWERCTNGHFFTDLSLEDSRARCLLMDQGPVDMTDFDTGRKR